LLLEAILKHTPNDSPDRHALAQVVVMVREFLAKVNTETGKTENRFNLLQLDQQLVFKPGEEVVRVFLFLRLGFALHLMLGLSIDLPSFRCDLGN
jgi:hypothetical protein